MSNEDSHVVYVAKCEDVKNFTKIGKTSNFTNRRNKLQTSYPLNLFIPSILILCKDENESTNIEELLHSEYYEYNTIHNTEYKGTAKEWFDLTGKVNDNDIIKLLRSENFTNKILTGDELNDYISELNKKLYDSQTKEKQEYIAKMKRLKNERDSRLQKQSIYQPREYQNEIIDYILKQFEKVKQIYLELATGGGKSYIIYKILSICIPNVIVIFSPRKNINEQNIKGKYLEILNNKYKCFNCSKEKDFTIFKEKCRKENKKMIIVACPQGSNEKVYNIINDNNLKDIFVWFDEAHHTIENWVNKLDNKCIKFFLENKDKIRNKIFTSASPNQKHVEQYPQIFGELYSPIKVKELIDLKWLCPIIPHIFSLDNNDVDICNYNLEHFIKFNCRFGFSFHNKRNNAFNLFFKHYESFINENTNIKPFLLIGDDYKCSELDEIKLKLKYDFRSIELFENKENSMGYVVQQYSMGYDFNKINYIVFSDPKMSYSDIIQCIGRGIRPDGLGENRLNLQKNLNIMLPIYIKDEIDTDFNRIEGVLRYLVYDIEYSYIDMDMNFSISGNKELLGKKYDGKENMKSILLDLLRGGKYSTWKPNEFITMMKNNNIHDRQKAYDEFIKMRPELNLPEDPYMCFPDFTWEQTYNESPYYSKEECKQKISQIKEANEDLDLDELDEPEIFLNKKFDSKIPPQSLFRFYGGQNSNEYY